MARRQRSALALIGIVIGTASVVGTIIIGYNAKAEAAEVFRGLGIDTMVAQVTSASRPLTRDKTIALPNRLPAIDRVEPAMSSQIDVASDQTHRGATVVAAGPGFGALAGAEIASGRGLLPIDGQIHSAVIGSDIAAALSIPGRPIGPGAQIRMGSYLFNVVGVLRGDRSNPLLAFRLGEAVLVPPSSARRIMPAPSINLVLLRGHDLSHPQPVADAVTQDFATEQQVPVTIQTARQMVDAQRQQQADCVEEVGAATAVERGCMDR